MFFSPLRDAGFCDVSDNAFPDMHFPDERAGYKKVVARKIPCGIFDLVAGGD
jgi:hypothetical protein